MLRRAAPALALLLAALASGCAPVVRAEMLPALFERRSPVQRVAVAPFVPTGAVARPDADLGDRTPDQVASLVATVFADTLAQRVGVVPAEQVRETLAVDVPLGGHLAPAELARRAAEELGADAVLLGRVARFRPREGGAAGSLRAASVSFAVTLYDAPGGRPLWRARFDETQRALSENAFDAGRYPGRGFRWLSAEELATWGASEAALAMPLEP